MKRKVRQTRTEHRRGAAPSLLSPSGAGVLPLQTQPPRCPSYFPSPSQASSASSEACLQGGRERGRGPSRGGLGISKRPSVWSRRTQALWAQG